MKYDGFIKALDMDALYSPIMVVKNGQVHGLFEGASSRGEYAPEKVRHSMGRFSRDNLPEQCDGFIALSGARSYRGWYGWRWKHALSAAFFSAKQWRSIRARAKRHLRRQSRAEWFARLAAPFEAGKTLLTVMLCLGVAGLAVRHYRPVTAWGVLRQEGPAAALDWIQDPRTGEEKFIQAWSLHNSGGYEAAGKIVKELIKLKKSSKSKGDAYYLAGKLAERKDLFVAMEFYSRAVDTYLDLNAFNSSYLAYLSIANIFIARNDFGLAENYLELARNVPAEKPNLGYLAQVESNYHFRLGDYQSALEASRRGFAHYQGKDMNNTIELLSAVGFYEILVGQWETGLFHSLECQRLILEKGTRDLYFYNQINLFLYQRCIDSGVRAYYRSISQRIEKTGDQKLKDYLAFAESHTCEPFISMVDTGTGPPPPPDGQTTSPAVEDPRPVSEKPVPSGTRPTF